MAETRVIKVRGLGVVSLVTRRVGVQSLLLSCLLLPSCGSTSGSTATKGGSSPGGTFAASGGLTADLRPDATQPTQCDPLQPNLTLEEATANGTKYRFSLSATRSGTISLPAAADAAVVIKMHNRTDTSSGQTWSGSGTTLSVGTVTIAADYQSGSLDVTVPADPSSAVQPVHLVGSWKCH